jgi:hypothetical protein
MIRITGIGSLSLHSRSISNYTNREAATLE